MSTRLTFVDKFTNLKFIPIESFYRYNKFLFTLFLKFFKNSLFILFFVNISYGLIFHIFYIFLIIFFLCFFNNIFFM